MASLARLHAVRGEREEVQRLLTELLDSDDYVPSYEIAKAWYALGEQEKAEQWLERAYEQRSHSMVFLRIDPQLKAQQGEPGFVRLAGLVAPETQR